MTALYSDFIVTSERLGTELTYVDQIVIQSGDANPFSADGDSGALVLDEHKRAIGLLFAGGETAGGDTVSLANHFARVQEALFQGKSTLDLTLVVADTDN